METQTDIYLMFLNRVIEQLKNETDEADIIKRISDARVEQNYNQFKFSDRDAYELYAIGLIVVAKYCIKNNLDAKDLIKL